MQFKAAIRAPALAVLLLFGLSSLAADRGWRVPTAQEEAACIASLEAGSYFPARPFIKFDKQGQAVMPRQQDVFFTAARLLLENLAKTEVSDAQFLKSYTTVRTALFRIEILAKLFRKAGDDRHEEQFERLRVLTKDLEDRLGKFNELDELVKLIKRRKAGGIDPSVPKVRGFSVKEEWELKRVAALKELRSWMAGEGWTSAGNRGAVAEIYDIFKRTRWLKDSEMILHVKLRVPKMLRKLQKEIAEGEYSPAPGAAGYTQTEVEEKVHELRREIRELGMVMQFTGGLFTFSKQGHVIPEAAESLLAKFHFVLELPVAKTPFARVPAVTVSSPIFIPRELFVLFTEYTVEIGAAKDWAQNRDRLLQAGLEKQPADLNQTVPEITDLKGEPSSLNGLMAGLIAQIGADQPFAVMASLIEQNP